MKQGKKYSVGGFRGLTFLVLCALMGLCGLAGAVRVGPPLFRAARRAVSLHQARADWHAVLRGGVPAADAPLCILAIPAAGLDLPVLADSSKSNLSRLPCLSAACLDREHAPVIVAHRDLHFRGLSGVAVGDLVHLTQRDGVRQNYRVQSLQVVSPHAAELLATGASYGSLTLITCYPFRYVGPAPERFVVICKLLSLQNDIL